jgi:hypothetical protein
MHGPSRRKALACVGARENLRTHVPTRLRKRRSRRAQRSAPHRRPAERVPPRWRAAWVGPYRVHVRHRRGVPRADVCVERRRLVERLRAVTPAVDADGTRWHMSACVGTRSHTCTRARTDAARGRVCAAGPHRRSGRRDSQTRMEIDTCIHHGSINCVCACSIDGWPYGESASHSHTRRVLAHRQRPHAIASVRKNTHASPCTYPDFASIYTHRYCT